MKLLNLVVALAAAGISAVSAVEQINAGKSLTCNPEMIEHPDTIERVQQIVRGARSQGKRVRAVAAMHSTNQILCTNGISIATDKLNKVLNVDTKRKRVTVQGGILLQDLTNELANYNLTIDSVMDFSGVSVAGTIGTAAHGSSLKQGAFIHDNVLAAKVVDGLGQIREVTSGDELLALRTHLGMLGIVVEVTLKVVDRFKVRAQQIDITDKVPDLENQIIPLIQQHDYATVSWFTWNEKALMQVYDVVPSSTEGEGRSLSWEPVPDIVGPIVPWAINIGLSVYNSITNTDIQCKVANLRHGSTLSPHSAEVGWFDQMYYGRCDKKKFTCVMAPVDDLEWSVPIRVLPDVMRDIRAIVSRTKACFPLLGLYMRFAPKSD
ncbi:hypothetical protein HK102_009901, partial [Quaeritorhiza haematococci]